MRKGTEVSDYIRIWTVSFAERFSADHFSRRAVAARNCDEALRKARAIERKESKGITLKVSGVERGMVLDG